MKRKNFKTHSGGGMHSLLLSFFVAMAMVFCSAGGAWAKDVPVDALYAVFDASTGTLTFKKCKVKNESGAYAADKVFMLWDNSNGGTGTHDYTKNKKSLKEKIKKIEIVNSMDIEAFNALDGGTLTVNKLFNDLPNLVTINNINNLDLSNVTDLSEWFRGCSSLQSITTLTECLSNAKKITTVSNMFNGCSRLEELDLTTLDVSKVTTFSYMFNSCSKLRNIKGLGSWQNSKATTLHMMFSGCASLTYIDLHGFNTSNVTSMYAMFSMSGTTPKLKAIYVGPNWNTDKVESSNYMFENCKGLRNFVSNSIDKTHANTGSNGYLKLVSAEGGRTPYATTSYVNYSGSQRSLDFFYDNKCGTSSYYYIIADGDEPPNWVEEESKIVSVDFTNSFSYYQPTSCYGWFKNFTALETVYDFCNLNTYRLETMAYMFYGCTSLSYIYLNKDFDIWDLPCTNYDYMFYNCKHFYGIKASSNSKTYSQLRLESCTMAHMFDGCSFLKMEAMPIYQSTYNKVTDLSYTFSNCTWLKGSISINIDNTVTNMTGMFKGCTGITSVSINKLTPTYNKTSFTSPLNCNSMFDGCSDLTSVYYDCYDASLSNSASMFSGCTSLTKIYVKLNTAGNPNTAQLKVSNATNSNNMFDNCPKLLGYKGTKVTTTDKTYARIDQGKSAPGYFSPFNSKITYILNDGSFTGTVKNEYTVLDESYTIPSPSYSNSNYICAWTATGAKNITTPTPSITIYKGTCGDIELTAHWKLDIAKATVKLSSDTYTGEIIPLIVTYNNGKTLKEGTDFTANKTVQSVGNNPLTLTGIGDYCSTKIVSLNVNKAPITLTIANKTKVYGDPDPVFTYTLNPKPFGSDKIEGTLTRSSGENVGTYTISNQSGFSHSNYVVTIQEGTFTITKQPLNSINIVLESDVVVIENGDNAEPTVAVYNGNNEIPQTEYTVTYTNNDAAGTGKVTVAPSDNSNYAFDAIEKEFAIYNSDDVFSITYKNQSEETVGVVYTPKNAPTTMPQGLVKGYTVEHVYTDKDFNTEYDFDADVTSNLTLYVELQVNSHTITYKVDGEEYKTVSADYDDDITIEPAPDDKAGYKFSGWKIIGYSALPSKMPDSDIEVYGNFIPNKHTFTLSYTDPSGEAKTKTETVDVGTNLSTILPKYTGYVFVPSGNMPTTMPDEDVTINGVYELGKYTLTYMLNDEVYKKQTEVVYGTKITALAAPKAKTGHTFSGWEGEPKTMPDHDVVVRGSLKANEHTITYMIDGEVYKTVKVPYGSSISTPSKPYKSGYTFSGWSEIPETMPDKDLIITGSYTKNGTTPVSALPETADAAKVWSYNGTIYIETRPDTKYTITDINGRILTTSTTKSTHDEININQSGILIVIIGNQTFKVMN